MKKLALFAITILFCTPEAYAMSQEKLEQIHNEKVNGNCDWVFRVHANSDNMSLESLNALYDIEKNELPNPQLLEKAPERIASLNATFRHPSTTAMVLAHIVIGHLKQLDVEPSSTHATIINKIETLCRCRYFGMSPQGMQHFTAKNLVEAAQKYPIIRKNNILNTIMTELGNND